MLTCMLPQVQENQTKILIATLSPTKFGEVETSINIQHFLYLHIYVVTMKLILKHMQKLSDQTTSKDQ
jgi:hypothetical protein